MPGLEHGPSIKNPKVYNALIRKGMSKSQAAAISNAMVDKLINKLCDRQMPLEVKAMPKAAQAIFKAAFRQAISEEADQLASLLAMQAVKKEFVRVENEEGDEEWIEREEAEKREEEKINEALAALEAEGEGEEGEVGEGEVGEGEAGEGEGEGEVGEGEGEDESGEGEGEYSRTTKTTETTETRRGGKRETEGEGESTGDSAGDSVDFYETFTLDADTAKKFGMRLRRDGYLVAEPRVARTGIQLYRGYELGRPDMPVVRVMRPESEVFDKSGAMASLAHIPITLDHPDEPVNSRNWKEHSVGQTTGDVARDGDFVRVPLMIADKAAIDAAQSGTSQLSVGYSARLLWGDGENGAGEKFDAMQTQIRANHIAIVKAARGGERLNLLGDNETQPEEYDNMITRNIDGVSIELEDRDDQILGRHLNALNSKIADQGAEVEKIKTEIAALQAQLATAQKTGDAKDGEIAVLKKSVEDAKLTPEKRDKEIKDFLAVVDRATTFFGDAAKYTWEGKSVDQVKRDVVSAHMGDAWAKSKNESEITGAFDAITAAPQQDGFARMTQSFSRPPSPNFNDKAAAAYDKRNADLSMRWQKAKMMRNATA
jgi:uncharacterized protein